MIKKEKPKKNNKFFYIVTFLMILGLILGLILVIIGIDSKENTFLLVALGMIIMFISFSSGSGLIMFRIARQVGYCEVCGERKMPIYVKRQHTIYQI